MTHERLWLTVILAGLTVVGLPVLGTWSRRHRLPRCALDGAPIERIYAVQIIDAEGERHEFCCIRCADYWLARQTVRVRGVRVTDEVSGRLIEAEAAFFVSSSIVTNRATGNRMHVFEHRDDAQRHAAPRRGPLLVGWARPFAGGVVPGSPPSSLER